MRKLFLIIVFFCSSTVFALQVQPWFPEVYEFAFLGRYAHGFYSKVNKALVQPKSTVHTDLLHLNLGLTMTPEICVDGEVEFNSTSSSSFGFRDVALQGRYLMADDIVGDPVSLALGFNARYTADDRLTVSCPYYGLFDFEANVSVGKEFDFKLSHWRTRLWGSGVVGQATSGSPWLKGFVGLEGNYNEEQRFEGIFLVSSCFGNRHYIDISNFHGYGKVRQKAMDLAVRYSWRLGVWGWLSLEYQRRLLAHLCPENLNTFAINYAVKFSF